MAEILNSLIVARHREPSGFTWTLASRTDCILKWIEERYGARDHSFTLLGHEFGPDSPRVWFPGSGKNVIIQLSSLAQSNETIALGQLSHECVHLLDPFVGKNASVFEEGVATLVSVEFPKANNHCFRVDSEKYEAAELLARQALAVNPSIVRDLREAGTRFSDFTEDQIRSSCPKLDAKIPHLLSLKFDQWDGSIDQQK